MVSLNVEYCIGYCGNGGEGGCLSISDYVVSALELSELDNKLWGIGKGSLSHILILTCSCPTNSLALTL